MKQDQIISILRALAQDSEPVAKQRVAAAVVYRKKIVGLGTNKKKSHPFQKEYSHNEDAIFFHAEVSAIHSATREVSTELFKKSDIYVIRLLKNGKLGLAKPCSGCSRCIATFGIRNVYYSDSFGNIQKA